VSLFVLSLPKDHISQTHLPVVRSYPQLGSFRFFGLVFGSPFCVFDAKIHNWPQKNWVRSVNDAHFSTIGFNGFVWVWIGFFSVFFVHF
jgi:hypothetical protein